MKNTPVIRFVAAALAAATLLLTSACSSSTAKVKESWTAPGVSHLSFKKVAAIAATQNSGMRHIAEDAIASSLPNVICYPSYSLIVRESDLRDSNKVSEILTAAEVDGVVVMRMLSDKTEVSVTQSNPFPVSYGTFRGYYNSYATAGFTTTTVSTDRIIAIETSIYEVKSGKLVWSGMTESTNSGNIQTLIEDAVAAIRAHLVKANLITVPAPEK